MREHVRKILVSNLIGQDQVIGPILDALDIWKSGINKPRPISSFLLMGPTGSGKTHTAETVALALHKNPKRMIKVKCEEYQMEHEVAKLIGAPPGYLGHRETPSRLGQNEINAGCGLDGEPAIVLFDEIEKGAESLQKLIRGICDDGMLTTGDNKQVSFANTIIFMTSNLGVVERKGSKGGFTFGIAPGRKDARLDSALRGAFPPEFINQLTAVFEYDALGVDSLKTIVLNLARETNAKLKKMDGTPGLRVWPDAEVTQWLAEVACNEAYGARELNRIWRKKVELPCIRYTAKSYSGCLEQPILKIGLSGKDGVFDFQEMSDVEAQEASGQMLVGAEFFRAVGSESIFNAAAVTKRKGRG